MKKSQPASAEMALHELTSCKLDIVADRLQHLEKTGAGN
jgi:hypothetical protein